MPGGIGVRIDTHIYPGYEVPPFYDSMIAKLIVYAPTRKEAIRKMIVALEQFMVDGITTNIEFHYSLLHTQEFVSGNVDTGFVGRFLERIKNLNE
jgi:acetyl-CoA carboxylase biotin carboxylase subunit